MPHRIRYHPKRNGMIINLIVLLGLMFLVFPIIVVVVTSLNKTAYIQFPPESLSLKWFLNILQKQKFINGFKISLLVASIVTVFSTASGILGALALVRYNFKGKGFLNSYLLSPIILPEVVTGVCLLTFFSSLGMFNNILNLIIGHTIITIPYVIRTVAAVLYRFNRSLEEAAMNLGANPFRTFREVTLPLVRPAVISGALFAFIMSFDELIITMFICGRTMTLPKRMWDSVREEIDPTIASISTMLVLLSLILLLIIEFLRKKFATKRG